MQRFDRLLFLADNDEYQEPALNRAISVAAELGATLTILSVLPRRRGVDSADQAGATTRKLMEAFQTTTKEALDPFVRRAKGRGVEVDLRFEIGRPYLRTLKLVEKEGFDLVMKVAEGGGLSRLFGRTDLQLMRKCPCPVWIEKPEYAGRYDDIVAAIDLEPEDSDHGELNDSILNVAMRLAKRHEAKLHLVHAWCVWEEGAARAARVKIPEEELAGLAEESLAERRRLLEKLIERHNVEQVDYELHIERGDATQTISKVVADHDADLIVMGTVCRTGLAGLFFGNTAERVLEVVDRSVLALKPPGFEAPV